MVLTIFAVSSAASRMPWMASVMRVIASAPRLAKSCALPAESPASRAPFAFSSTVPSISCMLEVVSSRLAACSDDDPARDWLESETWAEAELICSEDAVNSPITRWMGRVMTRISHQESTAPSSKPTPAMPDNTTIACASCSSARCRASSVNSSICLRKASSSWSRASSSASTSSASRLASAMRPCATSACTSCTCSSY